MKNKNPNTNSKRIIRVLLTAAVLLLLCGAFCGAAAAAAEAADGAKPAVAALEDGIPQTGTYKLTADVTLTTNNLTISDGVDCTIDLNGFVLKGNGQGSVITIEGTGALTITDSDPGKEHRFSVDSAGVWTLDPNGDKVVKGGVITGGAAESGGAVLLKGSTSELTLNGGTIVGNKSSASGGGIYCNDESSEITIDGGNIIGNVSGTSGSGAGGAIYTKGAVVLKNGTISYNKSGTNGGGIYLSTGGSLVMENGSITDNISGRNGGGVAVFSRELSPGFVMNGGEISNNTVSGCNTVSGLVNCGGGVAVYDNSTFIMNGGTIKDNKALDGANGGGVGVEYSDGAGTFFLNGGTITGNCAEGSGSGIYIGTNGCTLVVSGSPYVKSNVNPDGSWNNIQAAAPENIILAGKLDDAALLYVSDENEGGDYVFAVVNEDYASAATAEELAADSSRFRFEADGAPGFATISGRFLRWGTVYTVSFDTQGYGTPAPADQRIHQNGRAAEPAVTEPGRTVSGWYSDETFTAKWDFDKDRVASDMTLYAKWESTPATSPGFGILAVLAGLGAAAVLLRRRQ